jgi:hypothetical protein
VLHENIPDRLKILHCHYGTCRVAGITENKILGLISNRCLEVLSLKLEVILLSCGDDDGNSVSKKNRSLICNEAGLYDDYFITGIDKCSCSKIKSFGSADRDKTLAVGIILDTVTPLDVRGNCLLGIGVTRIRRIMCISVNE